MKESVIAKNKEILDTYFKDYSFIGSGNFFDAFLDPFDNKVFKVFNITSFFKGGYFKNFGFTDEHDFMHALKFADNLETFLINNVFRNSYKYPLFCKENSHFDFLPKVYSLNVLADNYSLVIETEFLQPCDSYMVESAKNIIISEPFFSLISGSFDLERKLDTATENFMLRGNQIVLNDIISA